MNENLINKITLDNLINKDIYAKYVKQHVVKNTNKKDKKFYRKRIYSLTKELLLNQEENMFSINLLPEVKSDFDNYINTCIHYFKSLDNNDLIQKELNVKMNENKTCDSLAEINRNFNEANKQFVKTLTIKGKTLDNFVIKNKLNENSIILPKEKNIDLRDPVLRTKGVKNINKKKNINLNYEETNKTDEKNEKCQNK
jgi:hypothetical protein